MSWFIYALLTAFLSSLAAIFEKRTLSRLHSIDFSAGIAFTTALLTLPVLFTASWETLTPRAIGLMFLISFSAAWGFINVTRGVRHMEISLSAPLFLLGPLVTTLFAFLLLGERVGSIQIMGMFILFLGAYILETKNILHGGEFLRNIWGNKYSRYILYGLILYGLSSVGDRIVVGWWDVPVLLYTAIIQLFIALQFLYLTYRFRGSPLASVRLVQKYWASILVLAILTIGYRMTYGLAIAVATSVGLVVAIKRSSSLFTTIIGGGLFHDTAVRRKTLACIIMLLGVMLVAL